MVTENQILDSMRNIIDPDLGRDIVSLGFIKDLKIDGSKVSFDVELTTHACPMKQRFKSQCEEAVGALPGVDSVAVRLTARPRPAHSVNAPSSLDQVDSVVAISSCKGGVGKSTVAAHLGRAMARQGLKVGLLDADIFGPSFPTLFNLHSPEVYVRDNRLIPLDIDGMKVMSLGFLLGDSPAVMRGPMVAGYTQQILTQTEWGALDYLLIDMPPGTGDVQLTLVQQAALDGAIIVTTPQALSLVDVSRGILMFEKVNVPVLGIVENMSHFVCDNCDKKQYLFGRGTSRLTERFGLKTLAELPIMPGISHVAEADAGEGIVELKDLADNLHREIGRRRADKGTRPEVTATPGKIHVKWPDGTTKTLDNKAVRVACPCAQCVDEYTGEKLLDPATVPDDVAVEALGPLGNYAVSIVWSDGHTTGIYSWDLLKRLPAAD